MTRRRKTYDREFKIEAVKRANEPGQTKRSVQHELGLYDGALYHWERELEEDSANAFPGKGHVPPGEEENRRLKNENYRLARELEILKKAVAIFSKDGNRFTGS